jgi:phage terminase large subunit-like protein
MAPVRAVIGDPGDGDSPSCAIIDEYHEHDTDALYTTMTTGMGAREQPMTLIITTAGFDIASPCYEARSGGGDWSASGGR